MDSALTYLFGSETKARILRTLFANPQEAWHLRGLASAAGVESGNALKTLRALAAAHLVKIVADSRGARYQPEDRSPLFEPLRQLFLAAGALVKDLKDAAARLPADQVLLFGSVAKGTDLPDSDVDVLVIGKVSSIEAQAAFKRVGRKHRREVNVLAMDEETLARQAAQGSPFWHDVLNNRVIMLKGEKIDAAVGPAALG